MPAKTLLIPALFALVLAAPAVTAAQAGDTLPSVDEITRTTDLSAFMKPGVPEDLRRAALRRAWSVDPAVRDFVSEATDYTMAEAAPAVPQGLVAAR